MKLTFHYVQITQLAFPILKSIFRDKLPDQVYRVFSYYADDFRRVKLFLYDSVVSSGQSPKDGNAYWMKSEGRMPI